MQDSTGAWGGIDGLKMQRINYLKREENCMKCCFKSHQHLPGLQLAAGCWKLFDKRDV